MFGKDNDVPESYIKHRRINLEEQLWKKELKN